MLGIVTLAAALIVVVTGHSDALPAFAGTLPATTIPIMAVTRRYLRS